MIGTTLPNTRMTADSGICSEIRETLPVVPRVWKTEPANLYLFPSATSHLAEITWEPVILPLLERLAELRSTPECDRWPDADWPVQAAFQDAGKFTERLPRSMRVRPHISLADDGEVNFSWSHDAMQIDLGFYGTGRFSFFARDKSGKEWFGDDIPVQSSLPAELRILLAG